MIQSIRFWSLLLCFFLIFVRNAAGQRMRDLIDLTPQPGKPTETVRPTPPSGSAALPGLVLQRQTLNPAVPKGDGSAITPAVPSALPWRSMPLPNTLPPVINSDAGRYYRSSSSGRTTQSSPAIDPAESLQQILINAASVFEETTEDELEERELQFQRQQAEQIIDPDRRNEAIARVERSESAYKNKLARRRIDEAGADLFTVPHLKEQFLQEGWCQLFDGRTQTGWNIQTEGPYAGGQFTFDSENGICSNPYHPGLIYTSMPFGDVTLRFDFCAEKDSEVFLLLKTPPNPADLNRSCYTFVLNSTKSNRPRGILLGRHGLSFAELRTMREMYDLSAKENENGEEWHSVLIQCEESDSQFRLNNQSPMTYFDPNPLASGHIAFLVAKGKARFKNIVWKPHSAVPIFDTANKMEIPWRVSEGTDFGGNHMTQFRLSAGTVESRDVYENFILQMQYYQGKPSGQSSLFVRSVPELPKSGYEISLQNFPKRGDRESVVGVDAGAFRQIKDARYVRAQDQQWTFLTVAAAGRRLQTWVNGVPVCEIQDRRSVRANSPVGPFLQPGAIRWSVPPENTLFEFRQLMVSPINIFP